MYDESCIRSRSLHCAALAEALAKLGYHVGWGNGVATREGDGRGPNPREHLLSDAACAGYLRRCCELHARWTAVRRALHAPVLMDGAVFGGPLQTRTRV